MSRASIGGVAITDCYAHVIWMPRVKLSWFLQLSVIVVGCDGFLPRPSASSVTSQSSALSVAVVGAPLLAAAASAPKTEERPVNKDSGAFGAARGLFRSGQGLC